MDAKNSVEATGNDVEAAVAAGLEELGVGPGDVLVEVLEEPSRGVFGIGAKQARVRLKLLRPTMPRPEPITEVSEVSEDIFRETEGEIASTYTETSDDVGRDDGDVGKEVLEELLNKMGIVAEVSARIPDPTHPGETVPWILDINGPDMSLLIGRRGETLSALQFITRLIASRRLQRRANIVVDAGEYKFKRSQRLRQLAERMANQAVEQARTVTLEPMPPDERRIIHLTLRNRDDVVTKSMGEGSSRKVTIIPK